MKKTPTTKTKDRDRQSWELDSFKIIRDRMRESAYPV